MTYNGLFVRLGIPVVLTDEVQMFKGSFLEDVKRDIEIQPK